ncbi:SRPBCC family protein [Pseudorhodobacter sp.]|uniref:SRPBCC family protein n=1 Tax=Pseudorhodobacter sp. TaxID=1934400 RepID=UPI002649363C|nr:SRPBCC family protein [Pseudorhodobacter sp.]MDN5787317.1 SRPBCC family protein [Pseudorhodobacter sp.]
MKITIEAKVNAPIDLVWQCWTTPEDIKQWNAASDDWHTTAATVDLRAGGRFSSRMEAKDGSLGFDFSGQYLVVEEPRLIVSRLAEALDGREVQVEFTPTPDGVIVRESFEAEDSHSEAQQRDGWQAILDRFAGYVEAKA